MRKNKIWKSCCSLCMLCMLVTLASCEKSLMSYEGPESIYFSMQKNANPEESVYLPDASINLMNQVGSEVEFGFNVMVTGEPKD